MSEPCDLSATEARALIGARRLSPVELTQSCIARIEAVDPAINAMVARDFEGALAAARTIEADVMAGRPLGPLAGLPLGVKDLIDAKGLPTTFGSTIFRGNIAAGDEGAVARLRAAGAVIIGKTNTPEWGAGGNTRNAVYGATGNPFDPTKSAAGSSGGSGAALAAGMVPLATGSDTGGSCRNPAAFNGVVGFRPTPGLIPAEKRNMAIIPLSTLGPMARSVEDACLMLSIMAGEDSRDPLSPVGDFRRRNTARLARPRAVDLASLRVAITPDFGFAPTESIVRAAFDEKIGLMSSAFGRYAVATPDCTGADRAFAVLRAVLFLGRHRDLHRDHPDQVGPNVIANIEEGLSYSAADVADALALHTVIYRNWQRFFADHDVILTPAVTISPRSWRELYPETIDGVATKSYFHWLALAYAPTLVGHPAVSLPVGLDSAGMPFGLQIIGPRGGDSLTLGVAHALERLLAGDARTRRPVPDLDALRRAPPIATAEGFRSFG